MQSKISEFVKRYHEYTGLRQTDVVKRIGLNHANYRARMIGKQVTTLQFLQQFANAENVILTVEIQPNAEPNVKLGNPNQLNLF